MNSDTGTVDATLVQSCARVIVTEFARYNDEFRIVTRRAPDRFENCDWSGMQRDVVERLDLYGLSVNRAIQDCSALLGARKADPAVWKRIRDSFAGMIEALPDPEFLKTFFSSITRRMFGTVGVSPDIEFFALDLDPLRGITAEVVTSTYSNRGSIGLLFEELLSDFRFKSPWRDFEGSVEHVTTDVALHLSRINETRPIEEVEVIRRVFYQMTRAYVVGRVKGDGWMLPIAIAFKNDDRGVLVDAVMLKEGDVSLLFGFTRSYFHVDLSRVGEAVLFLKSILPRKPVSELFTVLGRAKQGKTERFRELFRHLEHTDDRFVIAPGEKGLVMACFTLPSFDVVFKIIRDRFPEVKNVLREEVMAKYDMVFKHDRAGRLVDAQEFKRVRIPRSRFSQEVLDELLGECAITVSEVGDEIALDHVYIERKMTPLNLYVRSATPEQAEMAVIEYGQACGISPTPTSSRATCCSRTSA